MSALKESFASASPNHPKTAGSGKAREKPRHRTTRDCPRVTVRFSAEDFERVQALADGMSLSVYIRAMALQEALPRKIGRSSAAVADKAAIAQLLGLLGQSRIANNLNQLAYHANVGSLKMDDETRAQVHEAHEHVVLMRATLMRALGLRA